MSTFEQLQRKNSTNSTHATPTSLRRSSGHFTPAPVPTSDHVSPDQQTQPTGGTHLQYSLADTPLFSPDQPSVEERPASAPRKLRGSDTLKETMPREKNAFAERIRQAARQGVQTPISTLPFIERIQRSFGRHNISHIQAHAGPQAAASAQAMQAAAYTMGEHVVFSGRPDLHTVAHEAAHVVQQRRGTQLTAGIGQRGDRYEQHADAIAYRVTAGQSAEDLLDYPGAGKTSSSPVIQRSKSSKNAQEEMEKALEEEEKKKPLGQGPAAPPPSAAKKKKKGVTMSLGQFRQVTAAPPPAKVWGNMPKAAKAAPSKEQEKALKLQTQEKASEVVGRIKGAKNKWKPSQGHGGIKALDATVDDLQEIAAWAQEDSRYFIVKGPGTGEYSDKNQLKIIHKSVDDEPSGKKATFHITARQEVLDQLKGVEEGDE